MPVFHFLAFIQYLYVISCFIIFSCNFWNITHCFTYTVQFVSYQFVFLCAVSDVNKIARCCRQLPVVRILHITEASTSFTTTHWRVPCRHLSYARYVWLSSDSRRPRSIPETCSIWLCHVVRVRDPTWHSWSLLYSRTLRLWCDNRSCRTSIYEHYWNWYASVVLDPTPWPSFLESNAANHW